MIPAWHQLVPISGHVEESETVRKLQLYATSIKTSVSTRLQPLVAHFKNQAKNAQLSIDFKYKITIFILTYLKHLRSYGKKQLSFHDLGLIRKSIFLEMIDKNRVYSIWTDFSNNTRIKVRYMIIIFILTAHNWQNEKEYS